MYRASCKAQCRDFAVLLCLVIVFTSLLFAARAAIDFKDNHDEHDGA